ncbi:hypothetical protein J5N97_028321 [Dioscorea zingiberensis]|uniref:LisH domain-containing protein n=1 Tax=Dioscorea zingiberensis TaxID=325984 RepID=A0A9D5H4Q1_9LILI|nr:hypothetical protein J5N97_028321 [Dioscorea zingiberensis]
MLENPQRLIASSLVFPFVPRQIMLENRSKEILALEKKPSRKAENEKKQKMKEEEVRVALLSSIASYLDRNGFSKTLSAFRSEAQLEMDGCKSSTLNLEEVILNILETSDGQEKFSIEWCRDQGMEGNGIAKRDEEEAALDTSHHIDKKKRKKSSRVTDEKLEQDIEYGKGVDRDGKISEKLSSELQVKSKRMKSKRLITEDISPEMHKSLQETNDLGVKPDRKKSKSDQCQSKNKTSVEDSNVEIKDKKIKGKLVSDSNGEITQKVQIEVNCETAKDGDHENQLPQPNVADKEKKKKKHKMIDNHGKNSENSDLEIVQNVTREKIEGLNSVMNKSSTLSVDSDVNCQTEKKKERKENLDFGAQNVEEIIDFVAKHAFTENPPEKLDSKKKDKKKKEKKENNTDHEAQGDLIKSLPQIETTLALEENINGKVSKKRKRPSSEGTELQIDNVETVKSKKKLSDGDKDNKETGTPQKADISFTENDDILRKRLKTEENKHNFSDSSPNGMFNASQNKDGSEDSVKNVKEGGTSAKSMKKVKRSVEPKTVNAFQRVKVDEVKFVDDRLQDNSYWAKDGADIGYGAKAQEVLGQVKGRDFRHEKTKKKRGTYRGGQIDLQSHSIKFNYSDDE